MMMMMTCQIKEELTVFSASAAKNRSSSWKAMLEKNFLLVCESRMISKEFPLITDIFTHLEPKSSPKTQLRTVGRKESTRQAETRVKRSSVRLSMVCARCEQQRQNKE